MSKETAVAVEALRSYPVEPKTVRLAAESFNSVFRVTTAVAVYALRVGAALQIHPDGTAAVEAAWHRRLRAQGVFVPDVLANRDGGLATLVPDEQADHGSRVCLLFEWVAGRSLRTLMTAPHAADLGRLSARPQEDGAAWSPPGAIDVLQADRVLYWRVPDQLAAAGVRFGFGRHGLVPIDFQDTVRGFEVQDLSITISALRRRPDGDRLAAAFRSGYSEQRAWPDVSPALLDSLIVARGLQQLNLTLHATANDGLESYVAGHAERVRTWMRHPAG